MSGLMTSAAAEGVGARRSAIKSAMVTSVSCPTAATIGRSLLKMALATGSVLNDQRSSSEPPPRVSSSASNFSAPQSLANAILSTIWRTESSPCTAVGITVTSMAGKRRFSTCSTSLIAAPVGEVITPRCWIIAGMAFFASGANRPSAASCSFNFSKACRKAPSPASSMNSPIIWKSPRPS